MRRYDAVSWTRPYASLATMKASSAKPTLSDWPLPRRASRSWSGLTAALMAMATEPSKLDTVSHKAVSRGTPEARRRDTSTGTTLVSHVISGARNSRSVSRRSR